MVMPGVPASPKKSAHSDHPNAASTPTEMSVSMVAAPWRRFSHAALWKGQAPHVATGAASVSASHCQLLNCSAENMAIATTGTVNTSEPKRRWRSEVSSSGSPDFDSSGPSAAVGTVAA